MIVAKLYKLWERKDVPSRADAKDALDLFRLLRAFSTEELAERFAQLRQTESSQQETQEARVYLMELFADEVAYGTQQVGRAVGSLANRDEIIASSVLLAHDLLDAIDRP